MEIAAVESRVTHPRSGYLPPLIEHAYPFGVAADLERVPWAEVTAFDDAARKRFGVAFRARLQLPADAVPTHPLIFWTVRVCARADKRRRSVSGEELVWECERVVEVLPWWVTGPSRAPSTETRSTRVLLKSGRVSEAA